VTLKFTTFHFASVLALVAAGAPSIQAQTLNQPNPIERLSDVTQFGVPRDAKFVFCDGDDCPERTIKHLYVPPPPPPPVPDVTPAPQSVQPPATLSPAKDEPAKKPAKKKRPKRKKPAVQYECKPIAKK
jgi:hypothetical protein